MDETNTAPSEPAPHPQVMVQRKLGRCLIYLQQYEKLLKAIVSSYSFHGSLEKPDAVRDTKTNGVKQSTMGTLGTLVNLFTEACLTQSGKDLKLWPAETDNPDQGWVGYRFQLKMTSENYDMTKTGLKELVVLRNMLVHHFVDQYDLWSAEGCREADNFLEESYKTIHQNYLNLREWATSLSDSKAAIASWLGSQDAREMLESIFANRSIGGPGDEIYGRLREAGAKFSEHGWTHLGVAIHWINSSYPDQTPKRYGFKTWKQLLHESPQFETRRVRSDDKSTVLWYRCRAL